ncbi:MAG: GGDEF domain-containing protein, partial [Marinomonas sp.]
YGGEEFVIFMPNTTQHDALKLAEKIRIALKTPIYTEDDKPLSLTASIGLCEISGQESDLDICLNNADKALYVAKKHGKDQTKVYSEEM